MCYPERSDEESNPDNRPGNRADRSASLVSAEQERQRARGHHPPDPSWKRPRPGQKDSKPAVAKMPTPSPRT